MLLITWEPFLVHYSSLVQKLRSGVRHCKKLFLLEWLGSYSLFQVSTATCLLEEGEEQQEQEEEQEEEEKAATSTHPLKVLGLTPEPA